MDFITYKEVARRIAAAETPAERKEAELWLVFYYRFGKRESTSQRMVALREALLEATALEDRPNV
jgi:hypothetical protein